MIAKILKSLRVTVSCMAIALLAACGGGASGNSGSAATYDVSTTMGMDGSISPSSATVNGGGTTRFTVTPNSGYAINSVTGCGGTLSGNAYTTGAINANCTVSASFVAQYTVTAMAGAGGTITPPSVLVNAGNTAMFTVTPNRSGYVATVMGCDGTLSGSTYTTGTITVDCAVTATFVPAFTWVSGSNTVGGYGSGYGVYGTEGIAAATNVPGVRENAVGWIDHSGNLWLFGGYGWSSDGTGHLNDLWKYSPLSDEWTWVGGSDTAYVSGTYGTQGVAAPTNAPGGRYNAASWTDASGNLWLFGGFGLDSAGNYGDMSDLWEFSPSSDEWTWVSGSDTVNANGVYGTEGVASSSNVPGARENAVSWTDRSGDLWLFGGWGSSIENDLWEYSPSSNKWTWMDGSSSGCNGSPCAGASGVYGTRGVPALANVPGARYDAVSWIDASGNLWLFGGLGYDANGTYDRLNDLWEYSPVNGEWTWISGSNTVDASGIYGTEGVAADQNMPGARSEVNGWVDASGNLWLFGGFGFDSTGNEADLNDLWNFSPSSGEWTWVGGYNTGTARGVYGTEGVAAASNWPGGRYGPVSWIDSSGNAWLFGGQGVDSMNNPGYLNDLWKYPTQ